MKAPAGVRVRATLVVAVAVLTASASMALLTFGLTRTYLTGQRDQLAQRQAFLNARLLEEVLPATSTDQLPEVLASLTREGDSQVLLVLDGRSLGSSVGISLDDLPDDVTATVAGGDAARRRIELDDRPVELVGVPLLDGRGAYYEVIPLTELARTLQTMVLSLAASAVVGAVIGAALGATLARRVLRPLRVTSAVAGRISSGELDLRLPPTSDPDVAPLYESFNGMVDALATRIEREQRFAADVSHELRTPLTALVSSVTVLERASDQLPPRAQLAAEILNDQVEHLRSLVLDLLEMSRMESGVDTAHLEPVEVGPLVERLVRSRPHCRPKLHIDDLPGPVLLDPRRIERVIANLLDNADAYAGGAVAVTVTGCDQMMTVMVDDAGPGVAPGERQAIFERLHRGEAARRSTHRGSGLGLALACELLRLQGGSIEVGESPAGGARFVVKLPMRLASAASS
ncbi:MAG: HAMP domain-containing histidine kinase [Acidimicrobiia bacterium]|nr:HAMP domain-containing histidine kinase [Acidimicrobiia bacterium]